VNSKFTSISSSSSESQDCTNFLTSNNKVLAASNFSVGSVEKTIIENVPVYRLVSTIKAFNKQVDCRITLFKNVDSKIFTFGAAEYLSLQKP